MMDIVEVKSRGLDNAGARAQGQVSSRRAKPVPVNMIRRANTEKGRLEGIDESQSVSSQVMTIISGEAIVGIGLIPF